MLRQLNSYLVGHSHTPTCCLCEFIYIISSNWGWKMKKRSVYIKKQLRSCLSQLILLLLNVYARTGVTNAQNWFSSCFLDAKSEPNQQHIVLFPVFIYSLVGNSGWVLLQGCYFFPQTFIVNDMTAGIVKEHYFLCQQRCFQATLCSWVSIKTLNGADLR